MTLRCDPLKLGEGDISVPRYSFQCWLECRTSGGRWRRSEAPGALGRVVRGGTHRLLALGLVRPCGGGGWSQTFLRKACLLHLWQPGCIQTPPPPAGCFSLSLEGQGLSRSPAFQAGVAGNQPAGPVLSRQVLPFLGLPSTSTRGPESQAVCGEASLHLVVVDLTLLSLFFF